MSPFTPSEFITLTKYLEQHVQDFEGPMTMDKFPGGQSNPTFKVTAKSGVYVLRRQPVGQLLKSAHAVDREYQVLSALRDSDVPVVKVFHLCQDTSIIGSYFYLMEYCQGRVYWNAKLQEIDSKQTRAAMYDAMNKTLVALHNVNIEACGLAEFGPQGDYFKRQLKRWTAQYRKTQLQTITAMDQLIVWLQDHLPANDGRLSLVHGDYRLDNLVFDLNKPQIISVLDWELSTLGHPFSDLAYQCMQLRIPQDLGSVDGLKGIDRASLGIPTEEEYVATYCQRMGIEKIENWAFYLAFSFFRFAAIVQGIAKRAEQGNASNENANKVGKFVEPLAKMALDIIAQQRLSLGSSRDRCAVKEKIPP